MAPYRPPRTFIERAAVRLGLIPDTDGPPAAATGGARYETGGGQGEAGDGATRALPQHQRLYRYPLPEHWDDFVEHDPKVWPRKAGERRYRLVPTVCFNCESACGLLAYVDKQTGQVRKFEGNPVHPGSRGKNCAKGPATINQVSDPDRILTPMKRVGRRGAGRWAPVSWDEALADIGGRIRKALLEQRHNEIVYHVGRPGHEGYMDRVLKAWGIDGHNSHTNICSAGARLGYALTWGFDRPSPDYANARFILALNAHLESGHYFNPHAQRISEGLSRGAKMAVVDPRLSNTASMADWWLPTRPGTEAALLLALAHVILREGLFDRAFVERWVNWRAYLEATERRSDGATEGEGTQARRHGGTQGGNREQGTGNRGESSDLPTFQPSDPGASDFPTFRPSDPTTVDTFIEALRREYATFTPEFAEAECGIPARTVEEVARRIGEAGSRFCSHTWRGAASAHLGGWQVPRCLMLLHMLTGSVGTVGGCSPSGWHKFKPSVIHSPPPQDQWNELHWPREYPLAHYEMSFLLPHFLKEGRGRLDVYFTRVFNPVWTYPDGFTWIEALCDESLVGLHVALTPTWNETALFADYVLPMGHGPERHDLTSYETHAATWIALRQPVLRAHARAEGREVRDTRDVNPGQVWEEDEFWIALSWAIDPDGSLGIRKYFESAKRPGQRLGVEEYYEHIFERVPNLPEAAAKEGLTPLEYMRKYAAFEVHKKQYLRHERRLTPQELDGARVDPRTGVVTKNGAAIGIALPATTQRRSDAATEGRSDGATQRRSDGATEGRSDEATERRSDAATAGVGGAAREDREIVEGFPTPSRLLEFYSPTLVEWGWPEHAIPGYIGSHIWEEGTGNREQGTEGDRGSGIGDRAGSADRVGAAARTGAAPGAAAPCDSRSHVAAAPCDSRSHVAAAPRGGRSSRGGAPVLDACLLPTFRLPTLIHTRSGGAKWLNEISQRNPIWIHTSDARRLAGPGGEPLRTGDLVRINTEIGWFVDKVWVTESIRPGVVACSHHLGRWRRREDPPNSRWSGSIVSLTRAGDPIRAPSASAGGAAAPIASPEFTTAPRADADVTVASSPDAKLPAPSASAQASATPAPPVRVQSLGDGLWRMRIESGPEPFDSPDPDSRRIWWRDGGVPQNLTHAVHADPISGMHCWHQRVTVERARDGDRCGDVCVDTNKSMEVYRDWLRRTRWPVGPGDLRRPAWLNRPLRPTESAYRLGRET